MCKKYGTGNKPREDGIHVEWKGYNITSGSSDRKLYNYIFKRVDNFKYPGAMVNKMNNRSVEGMHD